MATQGIIFGGYFLQEEEFLAIFKEWYSQRAQEFSIALENEIINPISSMILESTRIKKSTGALVSSWKRVKGKYDASAIYLNWEKLSKEYFGNGEVTLIAAARFEGKTLQWTNNIKESQVITKGGISVQKKTFQTIQEQMGDINTIYAASVVQESLNTHFDDLLKTLDIYLLSHDEAQLLHILLDYRKSRLGKSDIHFTGNSYDNIIFSSQKNSEGKKLDAFMNHIGHFHSQIFALMTKGSINPVMLTDAAESLTIDDTFGKIFQDSVYTQNWLLDSLNTASWLSGGDIIVVNEKGAVIYNIQLKSTNKGKTFEVALASLLIFSKKMKDLIYENKPEDLAKLMFETLKTTVANESDIVENFYTNEIYNLVKEQLRLN